MVSYSILFGFLSTCKLFFQRKIVFYKFQVGKYLVMPDGKQFTIFRNVEIHTSKVPPQAYFIVRFKPKNIGVKQNIRFSLLPMMVFMGFKGFRSKYWAVDHNTGLCQGLYEWQTVNDAENYSKSIAMRFMAERSFPESLDFKIIDKSIIF